jgi:hypothetical protein
LSCAKSWCGYSTQTFVPNERFIQLLFSLLSSSEAFFGKAVTILKRLLSNSQYAKALEQMSVAEAFKGFPEKDMAFLRSTIFYIVNLRGMFAEACS